MEGVTVVRNVVRDFAFSFFHNADAVVERGEKGREQKGIEGFCGV